MLPSKVVPVVDQPQRIDGIFQAVQAVDPGLRLHQPQQAEYAAEHSLAGAGGDHQRILALPGRGFQEEPLVPDFAPFIRADRIVNRRGGTDGAKQDAGLGAGRGAVRVDSKHSRRTAAQFFHSRPRGRRIIGRYDVPAPLPVFLGKIAVFQGAIAQPASVTRYRGGFRHPVPS